MNLDSNNIPLWICGDEKAKITCEEFRKQLMQLGIKHGASDRLMGSFIQLFRKALPPNNFLPKNYSSMLNNTLTIGTPKVSCTMFYCSLCRQNSGTMVL